MNKFVLFIVVLFTLTSWSGPTVKENGAGLLELRFVSVWENRNEIIKPCFDNGVCQLSELERSWLIKIKQKSHLEKKLIFSSSLKHPQQYLSLKTETSVIGTEAKVGSQVYVNLDSLALRPPNESFEFPIVNLLSAWLYHHGLGWKESLEVSKKVAKFWTQKLTAYNLIPFGIKNLELQLFIGDELSLFVSDSSEMRNLTPVLLERLTCNDSNLGRSINLIQNATWEVADHNTIGTLTLFSGRVRYTCSSPSTFQKESWVGAIKVWIEFSRVGASSDFRFEGAKVRFQDLRQN